MTSLWLIANSMSRTTNEDVIGEARAAIERDGATVTRVIDLAEEELPDPAAGLPDIIASLGGDGTANAVIGRFGMREGPALLILPGGTMNLLAHRLHGEATPGEVIEKALQNPRTEALPLIEGPEFRSLVGVIAGPASAWGDVRETLRSGALETLVEDVRTALEATFAGTAVRLRGEEREHAALFIEPREDGLHAHDIQANSITDLVRHGWAWLNRDFLGGPTEELKRDCGVVIESSEHEIMLLVDGERQSAASPLSLRWSECPARFITTLES